ncbi:MAG: glycosyltransferase family 1 protein [Anaerolineaceae bacterium]|nr:glycosyltransferase family 1 protein [Anaerolineaceae bacterium]
MQTITLVSGGSRGDIQPFLLLGRALAEAGLNVSLALPASYQKEADALGLDFTPLRADFDRLLAGQSGQNLKRSGQNPLAVFREGQHLMKDAARLLVEDIWELSQTSAALVGHIGLSACTQTLSLLRGIPLIHVCLQPFMPTAAFPHPLLPIQFSLGGGYNRLTGDLVKRITWTVFAGETNHLLEKRLNQAPVKWRDYKRHLDHSPILNAFSGSLIPFPGDWKSNNEITGFWYPTMPEAWQAPHALVEFLESGSQAIFVGFGSVSDTASLSIVLDALDMAGERAVLVGFDVTDCPLPDTVFAISSIPYEWLFGHVKAAVYHGGAGTTALALRAKLPMLAVPQLLDQFFWADCVFRYGAAVKPIPNKKLNAQNLADAITYLSHEDNLRERAAFLGEQIQKEDGLTRAVSIIRERLSNHKSE